jgi:transposase
MKKRITVQAHLSVDQVEARYRKAQDPVERSHWQIIWLVAQRKTTGEVSEVTGYSASWIYTIVHRYNHQGPAGLGDRRHGNPGGSFILSAQQQQQLEHDLDAGAPNGGLWTGRKVAHWIFVHTGHKVHPQRGWEYLKRLGYSKRVLRPCHAEPDGAAQEALKKTFLSN